MRNKFVIFLTAAVLLFVSAEAAFGETSGWTTGFQISSEGFTEGYGFVDSEYVGMELFLEPWSFDFLTPALNTGFLLPVSSSMFADSVFKAEISLELFALKKHIFRNFIDLENRWAPLISGGIMLPVSDTDNLLLNLGVSPFRLKTGAGRYSILALDAVTDTGFSGVAFGIKIFDFRLFLF